MLVVSNTSPISNLAWIDRLDLLRDQFEQLWTPGRLVARQAGLRVRDVLGILLRAKATGRISSVQAEIGALRSRAGFFVTPSLEARILRSAGE